MTTVIRVNNFSITVKYHNIVTNYYNTGSVYEDIDETRIGAGHYEAIKGLKKQGVSEMPQYSTLARYEAFDDSSYQAIIPKGGSLQPDIKVGDLRNHIQSMKANKNGVCAELKVRGKSWNDKKTLVTFLTFLSCIHHELFYRERATFVAVTCFKENCFRIKCDAVAIL